MQLLVILHMLVLKQWMKPLKSIIKKILKHLLKGQIYIVYS